MQNDIFESPDRGTTVYARQPGTLKRRLQDHVIDEESLASNLAALKEDKLWGQIRRKANIDSDLKEMLDKVQSWYLLKYN